MGDNYANQPLTTISSGGSTTPSSGTSETWAVSTSSGWPAAPFHFIDVTSGKTGEIMEATAVSGTTWTVTRGSESTTTVAHSIGATLTQVVTAGDLASLGVSLDTTAADIQPIGVQAAGSVGKASDAGHVHPFQPWQFHVKAYGAKGDGQVVIDGAMSSSSSPTHLACTTSTPFANAAAGMPVHVGGAGGGTYTPLCTTIASKTDSGHVVLSASATSSVSSAIVYFGTDDTSAIQTAINDAVSYAEAHNGYAEVLFDPVIYMIGGAPVTGSPTYGNAQLTLPVVSDTSAKVTLVLKGVLDQTALPHWLQTTPQAAGTVLACARNDGAVSGTNGPTTLLGGPYDGYGAPVPLFSNMLITLDGIGALLPYNGSYSAFDFFGLAQANVKTAAIMAAAVVPTSSSVPDMATPSHISNFGFFGLRMPSQTNNDNCNIDWFSVEGAVNGIRVSEHTVANSIRAINCYDGVVAYCGTSGTMPHDGVIVHASVENCVNGVAALGSPDGNPKLNIQLLDAEGIDDYVIADSGNNLIGHIGFNMFGTPGSGIATGATGVRIEDLTLAPGHMGSPPSVPGSGSNATPVYQDAWVTVHTGGGVTVSAITVDGTATGLTMAASSTVAVRVPTGRTIALTYAGGTPTWDWWLD